MKARDAAADGNAAEPAVAMSAFDETDDTAEGFDEDALAAAAVAFDAPGDSAVEPEAEDAVTAAVTAAAEGSDTAAAAAAAAAEEAEESPDAEVLSRSSRQYFSSSSKSQCVWDVAYHGAVHVDDRTKQIGIATATW
jgi:hypothetical protein